LIKFQKKLLKEDVGQFVLESIYILILFLILFGIRRNCLSSGKELIIVPIDKKGDKTVYPAFLVILLISGYIGEAVKGGWRRQGRYAKSKIQKTAPFIEVEPLNSHQSTQTYILLAALIFPK